MIGAAVFSEMSLGQRTDARLVFSGLGGGALRLFPGDAAGSSRRWVALPPRRQFLRKVPGFLELGSALEDGPKRMLPRERPALDERCWLLCEPEVVWRGVWLARYELMRCCRKRKDSPLSLRRPILSLSKPKFLVKGWGQTRKS